jgi:hypothetical protein
MRIKYAYNHCFTILVSAITTTLSNGETTVVGSIIYQYGNNDNIGGSQGNDNGSPATTSPASESNAVQQIAGFLQLAGGWGFFAWVTMVMVVAA